MAELPAVDLGPTPDRARVFETDREVRVGDVDRHGRLRLDALATYLQDVAADDTADAGLRDGAGWGGWVVRRNVFEVVGAPAHGQLLRLATWASAAGSRWAERRLSVRARHETGRGGGVRVEGVSLWVCVSPGSLRPVPLDSRFAAVYGPATGGRRVSSRLQHPAGPEAGVKVQRRPWLVRATDIDPLGHVNNAATWAIVEELLSERPPPQPFRAELEHRAPIEPGAPVVVEVQGGAAGAVTAWVRTGDAGTLAATARLEPRPG